MIGIVLLVVLISFGVVIAYAIYSTNADVVSEVKVLNPEGEGGTALVIYHPGLSDFQYKVTLAFAQGLVSNGWRVEITTASSQAPADLTRYDLLVLGSPTYGGKPAPSIERYLSRVGDLGHKRIAIIGTGAGSNPATESMKSLAQAANGSVVESLTFFTMAPNEGDPVEMATQAGKEVPLP